MTQAAPTAYPLFLPPESLAINGVKNWSADEAQQYFDWFLSIWEQRVAAFLEYLSLHLVPSDPRGLLDAADARVLSELVDEEFSVQSR